MFYLLVVTYVLGGITFLPLLALAAVAYAYYDSVPNNLLTDKTPIVTPPQDDEAARTSPPLKAWLTVRRTFEASPASYISIVRTLLDSRSARPRRAEDAYYAVLKRAILYLYEDEAMFECAAAIDIRRCHVLIAPDDAKLDGDLFAKRTAIVLREKDGSVPATPSDIKQDPLATLGKEKDDTATPDARIWYIFFRSAHDMEDWYFAFLNAPSPFPHAAQRDLIDALDALPDRIPTRWLNALLGRLFLGIKGTRSFQEWVVGRLMKKLSKVKTPSWLTAVVVRSFDAGDVLPILSKPMLKELTPEGEASVGLDVSYVAPQDGGIRITVSATASITLPAAPSFSMLGFKNKEKEKEKEQAERPYEVSLVLAVIVRRIEGNMLIKIKRAPSNRLWYAFTTMPRLDIEVKPVVSDRQIRWGMVLSGIEGKLREIIQDSVVLPHMDDIPFFDTTSLAHRGGIFADAFSSPEPTPATPPEPRPPAEPLLGLHRARSTEALVLEKPVGGETTEHVPPEPDVEVQSVQSTEVAAGVVGEKDNGSMRKRRTWLPRTSSDGSQPGDAERDKPVDIEPLGVEDRVAVHRLSHSEDTTSVSVLVTTEDTAENGITLDKPPLPPRRLSSRSVSTSFARHSPPSPSPPPSPEAGLSRSAPSASTPSPISSSTPSTPNSHGASSFLATLKSRGAGMAEKQPALKEAMRKLGGTWAAALRKGDRDREREAEADHGEGWAEERGRNTGQRGSYAELRRKVEQRELERARDGSSSSNSNGMAAAHPVDIPHTRENNSSPSLERTISSTFSTQSRRTGSDSSARVSPPGSAQFLTPSAPKTTTELHTSPRAPSPTPVRSTPSTPTAMSSQTPSSPFFALTDSPTPPRPPAPIRAQPPKAATMTIPAIHARHRGDVMGFGSVPSVPPPASPSATETGKAMQTVYKLLRVGTGGDSGDQEPQTPPTARPVPPPLPPRSISVGSSSSNIPPAITTTPPATFSPASLALKNLAEQDAAMRQPPNGGTSQSPAHSPQASTSEDALSVTQEEKQEKPAGWKPPLPPRSGTVKAQEGNA